MERELVRARRERKRELQERLESWKKGEELTSSFGDK